jgi:hypothetical protein
MERLRTAKPSMSLRAMLFPGPTHRQPLLDNGTLKEARVVARVQHGGSGECEFAKIVLGDEALLNHLERFGYDIGEVRHIEVREVAMCQWP